MVYSFFYGIYIVLLTLLGGSLLHTGLAVLWKEQDNNTPPSPFRLLVLGIIAVSIYTALFSLFIPVSLSVHLVFIFLIVIGSVAFRKSILSWMLFYLQKAKEQKYITAGLMLVYITALSRAAGLISVPDTGFYHIPLVKWLNEYGLVIGLANLQDTYGFMSGWFYYASLFDFGIFDNLTYHVVNALAFTWGWVLVGKMLVHFKENTYEGRDYLIIPLSIYLFSRDSFIASLSPQIIISVLLFWMVYQTLSLHKTRKITAGQLGSLYLTAIFCVFIKLSAVPVLFLLIFPTYRYLKEKKINLALIMRISAPALILLVLFLYQNIILTGYLVYPVAFTGVLNVDWKVPLEDIEVLAGHIKHFGMNPFYAETGTFEFFSFSWFPDWLWRYLNTSRRLATILSFILLPLSILCTILIFFRLKKDRRFPYLKATYYALILGVVFWFFSNPGLRFGEVWILTAFFFPLALFLEIGQNTMQNYRLTGGGVYLLFFVICFYFFAGRADLISRTLGENNYVTTRLVQLYVPEYREVHIADSSSVNVYKYNGQPNHWDIPLPGTGQEINYKGYIDTNIVRRGDSLSKGFKPVIKQTK